MPPPPPPLPLSLRLHQKLLTLTLTPNQINQELKHQLISPFTLPLLRRALRKHTPTLPQLEQFLRPVLVPEEHAAGLASWYNDARFQAFVRKEYLQRKVVSDGVGGNVSGADRAKIKGGVRERTKYARTVQERKEEEGDKATTSPSVDIHTHTHTHTTPPWLSSDTDQDKDKPPRLPTHQEVIDFFHLHSWNRHLHPSTKSHTHTHTHTRQEAEDKEDAHRRYLFAKLEREGPDVSSWSLGDILEVGGACVYGRGRFNLFCEEEGVWEMWTEEYVGALAGYLEKRAKEIQERRMKKEQEENTKKKGESEIETEIHGAAVTAAGAASSTSTPPPPSPPPPPILILEVGAGDGALAYHLQQRLNPSLIKYIATDKEIITHTHTNGFVLKYTYEEALKKYPAAAMVLCSWMPMGEDWTAAFRAHKHAQEYILIGEHGERGCCGDARQTWGAGTPRKDPRPWEVDGFTKEEKDDLSQWQWSRYDGEAYARNSSTISFKRA